MTTIESKDLVIGQEYYDIPDMEADYATVLKFKKRDNQFIYFSYVRGEKSYEEIPLIRFEIASNFNWHQP